jgi:hypothetical protein
LAGPNQHHIPQCLQRGFLFVKKQEKTFVYRGAGPGCLERIKDVASENYFYSYPSNDGSKTLDDHITDYETRLGLLLIKLRSIEIGGAVESEMAAEVVAHLTPRSAHTRRTFAFGAERAMTLVKDTIADENSMEYLLGLNAPQPTEIWHERLVAYFEERPHLKLKLTSLAIPEELLDRVIFMAIKEQFSGSFGTIASGLNDVLKDIIDGVKEFVRESHNKSLGEAVFAMSHKKSLGSLGRILING